MQKQNSNDSAQASAQPFLTDITELRRRAREHILKGSVTPDYQVDVGVACKVLNEALATELVCVLRYRSHYYLADGIHAKPVADEFLEHAGEEQTHADWLAKRIKQLGGKPDFNPAGLLTRSHAEFKEGDNLVDMVKEDLIAERIAIESYHEMIAYFGTKDPTTRRLLERILEQEEEHADDMASILSTLNPKGTPKQDS